MVLRKVVGRMRNRSVSSAWEMWRRKVETGKILKRRTSKVVMRILKMSAARAFATWGSRVRALRVVRAKGRKVVNRLLHGSGVVALKTWRHHTTSQVPLCLRVRMGLACMHGACVCVNFCGGEYLCLQTHTLSLSS